MSGTKFVLAGSFIDGTGARARRNVILTVKNGIIGAVDSAAHHSVADGQAIDDFSHCTILPPLVDCSTSLLHSPSVDERVRLFFKDADEAQKLALLKRHIRDCRAHGVLGVADGSDTDLMEAYSQQMKAERLIDIRISGGICRNGQNRPSGGAPGFDFLRIGLSPDIEDGIGTSPGLDHEEFRRILQCRGKKKAVVVANGRRQVEQALEAGCDAIEQGYGMGEANLRRMASNGVLWIPAVLRAKNMLDSSGSGGDVCCRFSQRYVAPGKQTPGAESFWKKMLAEQLSQLRFARNAGVTTAAGTGSGNMGILHGESMVEEMKLFIKAGYSLEETVHCASAVGAGFFGIKNVGTLTAGQKATFLITRGTVKQLPRKLSYLEGICVDGEAGTASGLPVA